MDLCTNSSQYPGSTKHSQLKVTGMKRLKCTVETEYEVKFGLPNLHMARGSMSYLDIQYKR